MARTRTLVLLRGDVRARVDAMSTDAFVTDSDLTEWLNQEWAELYDILIGGVDTYYLKVDAFNTTAGTSSYDLPSDYYKTRGVDVKTTTGYFRNAHRFNFEQRNDYPITGWSWPDSIQYDIRASKLTFMPSPAGTYAVQHQYIPSAVRMSADSDTIDGVNGWELYVVAGAAMKWALKEDNTELASMLANEKAALRARITSVSRDRDSGEAPKVRVVRGRQSNNVRWRTRW